MKEQSMTTLSSTLIEDLVAACLFDDDTPIEEAKSTGILVKGIWAQFLFNPTSIAAHKSEIGKLLMELPDAFMASKGGGWSFLNACMDKHDRQWTNHDVVMEGLFVLGIACEYVKYVMPREMWWMFYGNMPYLVVDDAKITADIS
jgi:hypothetical protein